MLNKAEESLLRNECAESMGKQGDPEAIQFLKQVLSDDDKELRRTAIWSLGQIGTKEVVDLLFGQRHDNYFHVRRWVNKSLGRLELPNVITKLIDIQLDMNDEHEKVVADNLRAATTHLHQANTAEQNFWKQTCLNYLHGNYSQIILQASIILLNECFSQGFFPNSLEIQQLAEKFDASNKVIHPHIIIALGHAKNNDLLHLEDLTVSKLVASGISEDWDYLLGLLASNNNLPGKLFATLIESLLRANIPFIIPNSYIVSDDLDIQNAILEYQVSKTGDLKNLISAINRGKGLSKLISLFKYFKEESFPYLRQYLFTGDKLHRQAALSVMENFVKNNVKLEVLQEILGLVSIRDRIWHIRRDSRHLLKQAIHAA